MRYDTVSGCAGVRLRTPASNSFHNSFCGMIGYKNMIFLEEFSFFNILPMLVDQISLLEEDFSKNILSIGQFFKNKLQLVHGNTKRPAYCYRGD